MNSENNHAEMSSRLIVMRIRQYGLSLTFLAVIFRSALEALVTLSLGDERYSYILLIPPITFGLIALRRHTIFSSPRFCAALGMPLLALGVIAGTSMQPQL